MVRTGYAYAFLNYDSEDETLLELMERVRKKINLESELVFRILDKSELKPELKKASQKWMVKGGVISNCSQKVLRQLDKQPWVPAYDLSYVVKGKSSDGANFRAACYLNAIIQGILSEKYREKVFVGKVLYQGSAGRVEAV